MVFVPTIVQFPEETHAVEGEAVPLQMMVKDSHQPKHNRENAVGDYSRELSAVPVAMFGSHVEQKHAMNNQQFRKDYEVCC